MIGAMAKSAQFGLHTWLAESMEAPTPVSALIHAATMVTAGVYLFMKITQDYVLRREMRQFEGAWTSDDNIEAGRIRLERLGFFKEVAVETIPVPSTDDQIDVLYSVDEESTGSIGGNVGYSDFGLQLGFNLQEQNFMGTGNTLSLGINKNIYSEMYNFSFMDPYATVDGVSVGYNLYFRETDYGEYNVANYLTNSAGLGVQYSYPISDTQRLGLNLTYDQTDIDIGTLPAREIYDFVASEGNLFDTLSASLVWSRVTLNRGLFPTDGSSTSVSLMSTLPFSDLNYYKASIQQKTYQPLGFANLVFGFSGELGYMDAYGDTNETPFFQNFYAGGPRSLRGFESNTLGPRSTQAPCYEFNYAEGSCPNLIDTDGDEILDTPYYNPYANSTSRYYDAPIGGNVKVEGSFQLIFRLPFIEDQRSMRSAFFFDFGNVFSDNCKEYQYICSEPDIDELRYSYGVGVTWITSFGPMSFAIAKPTNAGPQERTEEFQFTVGNVYSPTKINTSDFHMTWRFPSTGGVRQLVHHMGSIYALTDGSITQRKSDNPDDRQMKTFKYDSGREVWISETNFHAREIINNDLLGVIRPLTSLSHNGIMLLCGQYGSIIE